MTSVMAKMKLILNIWGFVCLFFIFIPWKLITVLNAKKTGVSDLCDAHPASQHHATLKTSCSRSRRYRS